MTTEEHVRRLQQDGLLLLSHLSESGRLAPDFAETRMPVDTALFVQDPATLAQDPAKVCELLKGRHLLSRAAAPATVESIKTTRAYVARDAADTDPWTRQGRNLRRWFRFVKACTLAAALVTVLVLVHLDSGRRIVAQHLAERAAIQESYGELVKMQRDVDFRLLVYPADPMRPQLVRLQDASNADLQYCWPVDPEAERRETEYYLVPSTSIAQERCSSLHQQKIREQIIFARLQEWNCFTGWFNPITLFNMALFRLEPDPPVTNPDPRAPATPPALQVSTSIPAQAATGQNPTAPAQGQESVVRPSPRATTAFCPPAPGSIGKPAGTGDWQRTEVRTQAAISLLSGYLLPLLLGGIGGAVSVLRATEAKVRSSTLVAHDGLLGFGRILLATILGGLLALIFGTGEVQLGSFTLALAAWAFLLGYALDGVLRALDAVIGDTLGRLVPEGGRPAPAIEPQAGAAAPTGSAPRRGA